VLILAAGVLAPRHEVKKTRHADVHLFVVGVSAALGAELALADGVEDAGLAPEVVGELALVALGTVVLVVELAADFLGGLWADDLSLDGVGEEAVEAVLAVAHVEMDAGVEAAVDVLLHAFHGAAAFIDGEVLISTQILNSVQF
jgi:hypothetical protein